MRLAGTRLRNHPTRRGLTEPSKAGPVWNGQVRFNEQWLDQPLRWKRPRMIFVCAHGDLFHPNVPFAWIDRVFAVMAKAKRHILQVLTKRPERMAEYLGPADQAERIAEWLGAWPLPNVWLGFSAEDQVRYDERRTHMEKLAQAGWLTWLSAEPLLGAIDLGSDPRYLRWLVAGGESGPAARPMHPDWVRDLRDQCRAAGIPFHFKQWGVARPGSGEFPYKRDVAFCMDRAGRIVEAPALRQDFPSDASSADGWTWMSRLGKERAGRLLDGRTCDEMPELRP